MSASTRPTYSTISCRAIRPKLTVFFQSLEILVLSAGCEGPSSPLREEVLRDDVSEKRGTLWEVVSGEGVWHDGFISQQTEGRLESALIFEDAPPTDCKVSIRLKIRAGETYRSAGLIFDYLDAKNRRTV